MKIILRLFFIFFSFLSFAQINDSNVNLLINKISQTEAKGDTTSNDYANLINNLAIYYTNKGMYTQAEPLFIKGCLAFIKFICLSSFKIGLVESLIVQRVIPFFDNLHLPHIQILEGAPMSVL